MKLSPGNRDPRERISISSALFSGVPVPDDNNQPATKQDLIELRDELTEVMRDMQSELLRAFHAWARPVEIRLRAIPQIDERLGLLEDRVSALERGPRSV
jgi:hypothetical protein